MASIAENLLVFLNDLKANNDKTWFEKNKETYTQLRADFTFFIAEFLDEVRKLESIPVVDPKKAVFRIYRDVRFSKDKTPYKTNISAVVDRSPKWQESCSFYIHIEPGNSFVGGGAWEPSKDALASIRQEIDYNGEELIKLLNDTNFTENFGTMQGDALKKAPKGYEPTHQYIDLLKHKQFLISKKFSDSEVLNPNFASELLALYSASLPFFNFIDRAFHDVKLTN